MVTERTSLGAVGRDVAIFAGYVVRRFALARWLLLVAVLALALEYAAVSVMIPLAGSGSGTQAQVMGVWTHLLQLVELQPSFRAWLWVFFLVMSARLVVGYLQAVLTSWLGKLVHRRLSGEIFRRVVADEPLVALYQRSIGHYITLAGDDTSRGGSIVANLIQAALSSATALVALLVLFQFSGMFFMSIVGFLAVAGVGVLILLRSVLRRNAKAIEQSRELNTGFVEALNNVRSIRAIMAEDYVISTYAAQIGAYVRQLWAVDAIRAGARALPAVLLLLIAAAVLSPWAHFSPSEAGLFAGTVIIIRVFTALGGFVASGTQLFADIRAIKDIRALVDAPVPPHALPAARSRMKIDGLELRGVSVGYRSERPVLTGLHHTFRAGRTYAVVGPSGAGKSTLADVMMGFLKPSAGVIAVNGEPADPASLRGRIVLVEQQSKIFSASVRDNLLLGREVADRAVWDALAQVALEDLIRDLPGGLDARLSYQGENLSGGQRQRLGLARALIASPDVLLLDEATSALDSSTRESVVDNLRLRMAGGILVFITHDIDIARMCDETLLIDSNQPAPQTATVTA